MSDPLVRLARQSIRAHLSGGDPHRTLADRFNDPPQGCFVSLKLRSRLRGCIGTVLPTQPTLEQEVVTNAIAAATRDPRFDALRLEELEAVTISIDLLFPPEPVQSTGELDPARFGLVLRAGEKCGVLLPDLPGVETVAQQIEICRKKARIADEEPAVMERFQVIRIGE